MNNKAASCLLGVLLGWQTWALAQERPAPGYTVEVDVTVSAEGAVEEVKIVQADTYDLGVMAAGVAKSRTYRPQIKEDQPIRSVQRLPLFFPVEGDLGPESNREPKPELKEPVAPRYPAAMRKAGQPGGAILRVVVGPNGRVRDLTLVRASHPDFGASALEAVRRWRFDPARKEGTPVEAQFNLAVAFEVSGAAPEWQWYVPPRPAFTAAFILSGEMVPAGRR